MSEDGHLNPPDEPYKDEDTLHEVFEENDGNVSATARHFEVSGTTIRYWLDAYGIRYSSHGPSPYTRSDLDENGQPIEESVEEPAPDDATDDCVIWRDYDA